MDFLHPSDKVALVATARKITPDELRPSLDLLRSWGLEPILAPNLYAADCQFAGTDLQRAADLQWALDNPEVRAVICVRGGYGTVRIIDRIDFSHFAQNPKWIVGYSDVTVLHSHIHTLLSIPTLHATMPVNIPPDALTRHYPSLQSLHEALFQGNVTLHPESHPLNRLGNAVAPVVGGNLSILYSLCGSPSDISTDGKILFIEDLDEYLYHIDRMMLNLKRSGHLARLKGLLVGSLTDMHDNTVPFGRTAEQIVSDAVRDYDYPVCFNVPCGHIDTLNRALILGHPLSMTLDPQSNTFHLTQS